MESLTKDSEKQSNFNYHSKYEVNKEDTTTIQEEPETLKIKDNTKTFNYATYYGVVGQKIQSEIEMSKIRPEIEMRQIQQEIEMSEIQPEIEMRKIQQEKEMSRDCLDKAAINKVKSHCAIFLKTDHCVPVGP